MAQPDPASSRLAVLIVDDEPNLRRSLISCLELEGHRVASAANSREACEEARRRSYDLAFVDLRLGIEDGMDLIPVLLADSPWMKIVVITAYASLDSAVEAMRRGATNYLPKPFIPEQVLAVARKVAEVRALESKVQGLQDALAQDGVEADLNSTSPSMQRAMALARQVARSEATVLIRGESGTGKGVVARAVHAWSERSGRP
jgi:NtrC-family two-component system response regulator AlgB